MSSAPLVSIVIPVHNCWELTRDCLESILRYTILPHEIIVVNDMSTDETATELTSNFAGVKVLHNSERGSYSKNNNRAVFEAARGKLLCLLNNDTLVTPYWLEPLVDIALNEPHVGVVGNKHIFPQTQLLNHCGIGYDGNKHPWHLRPNTSPDAPAANYQRDVPSLTFACVLVPKDVFSRLGGLGEDYQNGYEDCDFCLKAKKAGYRLVYTPASTIYHYGQSTPGRTDRNEANWQLFSSRWGATITPSLEELSQSDAAYDAAVAGEKALRPAPPTGVHFAMDFTTGNALSWVGAEFANALIKNGAAVTLPNIKPLAPSIDEGKRAMLETLLHDAPAQTVHLKWSHYWDQHMRLPTHGDVNCELFVTNYRFRPNCHVDSWMRHMALNGNKKISISTFCKDSLVDAGVNEQDIAVVPVGYSTEIDELYSDYQHKIRPEGEDLHLLVITNSHDLYRYGTDVLVDALAQAYTSDSPVVIHMKDYGRSSGNPMLRNWIAAKPNFPRVVWHEDFVTKPELMKLYASMDALVAPFRGEGFGMKIIDAMALGVPVLMPAFGGPLEYAVPGTFIPLPFSEVPVGECYDAQHFHMSEGAYWCEVDRGGFADVLSRLPLTRDELARVGHAGRTRIFGRYSWDKMGALLRDTLEIFVRERNYRVSKRSNPSLIRLSVLMPTKDRGPILEKTLEGYCAQTFPRNEFEIVLVNDHGDAAALREITNRYQGRLNLRVYDNPGRPGPAEARNCGLRHARGEIVFITGDDIIPTRTLLEVHSDAHRRHPEREVAFVGYSAWHPELEEDWFYRHLIGEGGQQFNYRGMVDQDRVSFDRFYTSNVSLKRTFVSRLEPIFSSSFPLAAFEDIELAYRLNLHGMELRYLEHAVGLHLHPMTIESFLNRQRKAGAMLAVMGLVQPAFVPKEHSVFLDALDYERKRRIVTSDPISCQNPEDLIEVMVGYLNALDRFVESYSVQSQLPIDERDRSSQLLQFIASRKQLFNILCDTMIRVGMAEGWAQSDQDKQWARQFVVTKALPLLFSQHFSPVISSMDQVEAAMLRGAIHSNVATAELHHENWVLMRRVTELSNAVERHQSEIGSLQGHVRNLTRWISEFSLVSRAKYKVQRLLRPANG